MLKTINKKLDETIALLNEDTKGMIMTALTKIDKELNNGEPLSKDEKEDIANAVVDVMQGWSKQDIEDEIRNILSDYNDSEFDDEE